MFRVSVSIILQRILDLHVTPIHEGNVSAVFAAHDYFLQTIVAFIGGEVAGGLPVNAVYSEGEKHTMGVHRPNAGAAFETDVVVCVRSVITSEELVALLSGQLQDM